MKISAESLPLANASEARILILGLPGSGKSTLGKKIAQQHGLRHIECDRYCHRTDFISFIEDEIHADGFVLEGHFKDLKELLSQCRWTHVVWLDRARWFTTWLLFKREFKKFGLNAFASKRTLRFYLKNHKRLHSYQEKAFHEFHQNQNIKTVRLS